MPCRRAQIRNGSSSHHAAEESRDDTVQAEEDEEPSCWICLGQERRDAQLGALRSPCACRGSVGHVHERCLQEWVQTHARTSELPGRPSCPTCKQPYRGDLLLFLAASSALQMRLDLPPSAESRLITELQNRKMNREANALLRRRMKWNVLVADELHPDTLQGFYNVASAMRELKQLDAAAVLFRRVLKSAERLQFKSAEWLVGGRRHRRDSSMRLDIGALLLTPAAAEWEIEEAEAAIFEHERALAIAVDAADALADLLKKHGRLEEAERQHSRKIALRCNALTLRLAWAEPRPLLRFLRIRALFWIGLCVLKSDVRIALGYG